MKNESFITDPDELDNIEDEENPRDELSRLMVLADNLCIEKRVKADAEEMAKGAETNIVGIEAEMDTIMTALDLQNFSHAGKTFYKRVDSYPSIVDPERFFAFLEMHNEDGIVKRTVHPQTLRSWYGETGESFAEELVTSESPMLNVFEKIRIGVRSSGKK